MLIMKYECFRVVMNIVKNVLMNLQNVVIGTTRISSGEYIITF